ncbi:MAG: LamG domain-containing protein [Bacteroidales bacterium]|nr:LamG domain-containing protein [Bacteroidales bacterium]
MFLSWGSSSHHTKYVIVRNSSSGTAEFEVSSSSNSYTDNTVTGCETYKYELYAANKCTEDAGLKGVKATSQPSIRLQPSLGSYLTSVDASKAYYPDKVIVEWTVEGNNLSLVDEFVVQRRTAGSSKWATIGTVQGLSVFEDKTAIGGTIYEYLVRANLNCENDILSSNQLQTMGFRIPYAVVTGTIKYKNGTAVKESEVLAEKGSAPIGTSLFFDGNDYLTVSNQSKLNPSNFIAIEAWVRSETVSGTARIIDKHNGSNGYELYTENTDAVFTVNISGMNCTVRAQNVLDVNQFVHLAGVYDSTGGKNICERERAG